MTLQPTLIALVGPETAQLAERLPRWFAPLRRVYRGNDDPLPVLTVSADGAGLSAHVERLRSARLLQQLTNAGIAPPSFSTFRTILAVDASRWEEASAAIARIGAILDDLPFGTFPSRQFWIVAMGPSTIEEVRRFHDHIAATPDEGQSTVVFSIMPAWRGTVASPGNLLTAAERIAALLALADAHPASPLMQFLNARHSTAFIVGIEAYRLAGLDDAVDASVLTALEKFVATAISGTPPATAALPRIVRECCPAFDLDAATPSSTPKAEEMRREYLQEHVPKLLERLAGHASNTSEWLGLLERVRSNVRPAAATPHTAKLAALSIEMVVPAVLLAVVIWVLRRMSKGGKTESDSPPPPEWKPHPVLFDALSTVLDALKPLLTSSPRRPRPYEPGSEFAELLGEVLSTAESGPKAVEIASQMLRERNLAFVAALAAGWLTGEAAPVSACKAAIRVKDDCLDAVREFLLGGWVASCLTAHSAPGNGAGNYLFSPAQPGSAERSFLLGRQSLLADAPTPQNGLYPDNLLHFLYLVTQ